MDFLFFVSRVALKFLKFDYSSENPNPHELNMYWRIKDCYGFPRVIDVGTHEDFHIMVMEHSKSFTNLMSH
ncbi:hypothetical protein Leryth_017021 [Lithospermum erythrorhizon]|nr:hypothetical protein Leryth_017021 [Lithospermum erythrorhizon]